LRLLRHHRFQPFGITIQAEHREATLSRDQAQAFINAFGDIFSVRAEGASSSFTSLAIRGGNGSLPSGTMGFEDCQSFPKSNNCHECCADLGIAKGVCGKSCSNGKMASVSEPIP
jgi:hypothetical protein